MKKLFSVSLMILMLTATCSFAEMGVMKKNQNMDHRGVVEQKGIMDHGQMIGGMMDISKEMADMMGKMSGMMKDISKDKMKQMSPFMKQMSNQMMDMSKTMEKGMMSDKEMKNLRDRMGKMQNMMLGLEKNRRTASMVH